jgi:choline/glycine/proline betaine transport protein
VKSNPWVFFISAGVIVLFVLFGAAAPEFTGRVFGHIQDLIVVRLGWFYVVSVAFFLVFVLWLFISPYGNIRLGKDEERPQYTLPTWFAMLFSAGMGIGLLFYSVAEPVLHFLSPPGAAAGTVAAAKEAMSISFLHWGLHAWAIYIVVGLSLAFFSYRHNLPLTLRSTLYPLLGERIHGGWGHVLEIFSVFGTLFGVATSLGLGVMQINAGLDSLGLVSVSQANQLWLITGITLAALVSVVSGLDKGIRQLSRLNLLFGLLLVVFVFLAGPTQFLVNSLVQSVGTYLHQLIPLTLNTDAFRGPEWQKSWTMFYWGWWISWSPFVGMFIARVSRGRTIREFIAGVLFAPTLLTFVWFVVFGDSALHMELFGAGGVGESVQRNAAVALFALLNQLPLSWLTSSLAVAVVALFFVTSSDSGSMVIDIITSGGDPNPPVGTRVFWSLTEGAVAAVLLVTGGLAALQTAAVTTALPFCILMLVICYSLVVGLRASYRVRPNPRAAESAPTEKEP